MNRNVAFFAIFLVLVGLGFGLYLVAILGFLLLVPALISTQRVPAPRTTAEPKQETRRITPPTSPKVSPVALADTAAMPYPQAQPQNYSSALFPASMFPPLTQMADVAEPVKDPAAAKTETRDDLVEVGAILALLKLAFG